jgi:menaquinone-dependent protoporphyrinogen oxidase
MQVLVAYASRHGATRGIAERVAEQLRAAGLDAEARHVGVVRCVDGYDAIVVGSAAYMFHWLKEATAFVLRNRAALATKPVWLFSSGPLGTEPVNAEGKDQREAATPKELGELAASVGARGTQVFFGAYHRDQPAIGLAEHFMALLPAARDGLPDGDFRDWPEIDGWAAGIARELESAGAGVAAAPASA